MRHIGPTKAKEARQVERLVQKGPRIGIAADPPESGWEAGFDWDERDCVALFLKLGGQSVRLGTLTSYGLQARSYEGDTWQPHVIRLLTR